MKATRHRQGARDIKSAGLFIREHRLRCGLSQSFLADAIGVTDAAVSGWERGVKAPSYHRLPVIAKELELTASETIDLRRMVCGVRASMPFSSIHPTNGDGLPVAAP
mgnify:CR=1 FL=1